MLLTTDKLIESKKQELQLKVKDRRIGLLIIKVGNDKASKKYVDNKIKLCEEIGIESHVCKFEEDVTQEDLLEVIHGLNKEKHIDGLMVQLPLPKHLDENTIINAIDPAKDIDGFTNENLGKLLKGDKNLIACTPKGIMTLLDYYNIELQGKDVLIINRSNIVGKPLAFLMLERNATVTIAHSKTKDLENKIKNSDIVVTAIGKANMFNADSFSDNTTIIDVSINFDENGKMCGDVKKSDYNKLIEKNCNITPVPGGVGKMTVLSLIEQTIDKHFGQN